MFVLSETFIDRKPMVAGLVLQRSLKDSPWEKKKNLFMIPDVTFFFEERV